MLGEKEKQGVRKRDQKKKVTQNQEQTVFSLTTGAVCKRSTLPLEVGGKTKASPQGARKSQLIDEREQFYATSLEGRNELTVVHKRAKT